MQLIKVKEGQSVFDIALQTCGDVQAAVSIAHQNKIGITDELQAGQELLIPTDAPVNVDVLSYYKKNNIEPATANFDDAITEIINNENGDGQTPPIYNWTPEFL